MRSPSLADSQLAAVVRLGINDANSDFSLPSAIETNKIEWQKKSQKKKEKKINLKTENKCVKRKDKLLFSVFSHRWCAVVSVDFVYDR